MATLTVYPDPQPGVTSFDATVFRLPAAESWSSIRDGDGTNTDDTSNPYTVCSLHETAAGNVFDEMGIGEWLFDTSPLTASATISAATMSLRGTGNGNTFPTDFTINIYGITTSSNTEPTISDYQARLSTAFSDTSIAVSTWSTTGYNDYVFNASGLAAISKTSATKTCARLSDDVSNTDPSEGVANLVDVRANTSSATGTSTDPKLVITYTLPLTGASFLLNFV